MTEDRRGDLRPRRRGAGFPSLPLPEADRIVSEAGKYGSRHAPEAFAQIAGHTSSNSGPFRMKMAALRDWGLIEGRGEEVTLTRLSERLAHPISDEDRTAALQEAFSQASVFSDLYESSSKNVPLQVDQIANIAVHQLGITPSSKTAFAKSFSRSVVAAGLARDLGGGEIELMPPGSSRGGASGEAVATSDESSSDRLEMGERGSSSLPPGAPVFAQPWRFRGGQIRFDVWLDRPLPVAAFRHLEAVHSAVETLVTVLAEAPEEEATAVSEDSVPE